MYCQVLGVKLKFLRCYRFAAHAWRSPPHLVLHRSMALVASPLVLPPRDKEEGGPPSSSVFSATQTTEQGLSRFTSNPITFVKASDPPPSSVPLNSKYEILDDSKLSPAEASQSSTTVCHQLGCFGTAYECA